MNVSDSGRAFRLTGSLMLTIVSVRFEVGAAGAKAGGTWAAGASPGRDVGAGEGAQPDQRTTTATSATTGRPMPDRIILALLGAYAALRNRARGPCRSLRR